MNSNPQPPHDPIERAALLASGAEPVAPETEQSLDADPLLRAEFAEFTRAIEGLASAVAPIDPPASVRERLLERIESDPRPAPSINPQVWRQWTSNRENRDLLIVRGNDGAWEDTGVAGVRVRRLLVDESRNQFTALVRMAAGTSYPRHVHNGPEECLVLEGDIRMGDAVLHAGDYQYAPPDTLHGVQSTEKGCLLLITSSLSDELV
jgi:quercetin dioxygenase-like cupin family protein